MKGLRCQAEMSGQWASEKNLDAGGLGGTDRGKAGGGAASFDGEKDSGVWRQQAAHSGGWRSLPWPSEERLFSLGQAAVPH